MGVQPDIWIERMVAEQGMIEPFAREQVRDGISFGLSSYGYDFRLGRHYKRLAHRAAVIDPKGVSEGDFEDFSGEECIIPAGAYVLAQSLEYFRIPRNVLTLCTGKSTYARCGVLVNVTPFEPEWEGHVTLSISNTGASPVKIYSGEGIAQVIFLEASQPCRTSYRERRGKYQAQRGIVLSRVDPDPSRKR